MENIFFSNVAGWAETDPWVESVVLVGSWARGTNTETSDIDLCILTSHKQEMLLDQSFTARFGRVVRRQTENYGACTSIRVWYENGMEVEFGLVEPFWADVPLDEGTRRVLLDGYRVLADKKHHFTDLRL